MQVIGEAGNGAEAIESVRRLQPDVVLMDVRMPIMDGIEATRVIKQNWPGIRIIGLSMHEEAEVRAKMLADGADAYLTKTGPWEEIVKAIWSPLHPLTQAPGSMSRESLESSK